jgi:hypothetical protein
MFADYMARILVILLFLGLGGCGVERTLTVNTEPQGALVYLNGQEFGRTPVTREFTWYGDYDLVIRKDGYETVKGKMPVKAPWWQWIPLDLVAELLPGMKDRRVVAYRLTETAEVEASAEEMIDRGRAMEGQLQSSRHSSTAPTTQPRQPER